MARINTQHAQGYRSINIVEFDWVYQRTIQISPLNPAYSSSLINAVNHKALTESSEGHEAAKLETATKTRLLREDIRYPTK